MEDVQRRKSGSWVGCENTYVCMYIFIASAWVLGGPGGGGGVAYFYIYIYTYIDTANTHTQTCMRSKHVYMHMYTE